MEKKYPNHKSSELRQLIRNTEDTDQLHDLLSDLWEETSNEKLHEYDEVTVKQNILKAIVPPKRTDTQPYTPTSSFRSKNNIRKVVVGASLVLSIMVAYFFIAPGSHQSNQLPAQADIVKATAKGYRSTIILRDGSKVTLNAETKITYDPGYGITNRNISLDGEAFFEVAKNKDLPFVVTSRNLSTVALGTSFNVRDYKCEKLASISLFTGSVEVSTLDSTKHSKDSSLVLYPNEQAEFNKRSNNLTKNTMDREKTAAWREEKLYIENQPLKEIVKMLERWYDVDIDIEGDSSAKELYYKGTGIFERQSLEMVLSTIGYSMGFESQINEDQILIKLNDQLPMEKLKTDTPMK
ncbi:FecR family protein [Roseivirga thermotolerans]|uniref:FecR family protein n=1 Tax=Roseivirga thermotolerans TaxID=1758176 RepID=UPI00273F6B60|nr:FecR domain-containing protein [Roseivirga thermotolerans]